MILTLTYSLTWTARILNRVQWVLMSWIGLDRLNYVYALVYQRRWGDVLVLVLVLVMEELRRAAQLFPADAEVPRDAQCNAVYAAICY